MRFAAASALFLTWLLFAWPASADSGDDAPKPDWRNPQECIKVAANDLSTETFCNTLSAAWTAQRPAPEDDINALDVDFEHRTVDAGAVARLLAQPNLLPPSFHGGVIFRNVKLSGPLVLDQVTLKFPVTFNNAMFNGVIPLTQV